MQCCENSIRAQVGSHRSVGGVVAYLQGLVLAYNLGHAVRLPFSLAPAGIASVALVGYALIRDPP